VNVFTPFNALLGALLLVILIVGPLQDALFGGVLVANALVGIVQELRAKRTLDRLAVLTAPLARVVREGEVREIPVPEVVRDDLLEVRPGDQIVVDGILLASGGLEIDESLLTGESEPVEKGSGDWILSGSFVAAGSGRYRATRVGRTAYARVLSEQARRFTLVSSELRAGINRIIVIVAWVLVPTAALLFISQLLSAVGPREAIRGAVAGTVAMVPERPADEHRLRGRGRTTRTPKRPCAGASRHRGPGTRRRPMHRQDRDAHGGADDRRRC
jgi:cation-transporting P-type ATPase E